MRGLGPEGLALVQAGDIQPSDMNTLIGVIQANRNRKAAAAAETTRQRERREDQKIATNAATTAQQNKKTDQMLKYMGIEATHANRMAVQKMNASIASGKQTVQEALLGIKKDAEERKQTEAATTTRDFILSSGVGSEEAKAQVAVVNANPKSTMMFYVDPTYIDEWAGFQIPPNMMINGKTATAPDIIEFAKSEGVTPYEWLKERELIK